jgi:fibronectin type 3 domain-containing protein
MKSIKEPTKEIILIGLLFTFLVYVGCTHKHSVSLTWQSQPVDSFNIYRTELIATIPGNKTSFKDYNVEAGKTYEYKVTSVKAGQESAPSKVTTATVPNK